MDYSATMTNSRQPLPCPDCDEALTFAFGSTGGTGAHKRGDHYNTVPDTAHYVCFPCHHAWKQRLDGPLTPDIVGELSFFTCRDHSCGAAMAITREPDTPPIGTELTCAQGHRYHVAALDGGLTLVQC
jgi:hypothetical protein